MELSSLVLLEHPVSSGLTLDLRSWRTSLSYILGCGLSKSPPLVELGCVFFVSCGLSLYLLLDEVDSHLLLSLAGSVSCNMAPTLVKHSCVLVYSGVSHELRSCLLPLELLGKVRRHPFRSEKNGK